MSQKKNMRILVTGGAGFIGSALVWKLNSLGHENIVICDRLGTDEKWRNLVPLKFASYVDADELLSRLEGGDAIGQDITLVLHMGACSATTEKDAGYLMRNNFDFTRRLCQWSLSHGARFVYASSAATYGDGAAGMEDTLDDLHQLRPLNMYGYSKHLFDCWAKREGILSRIVGLKFFNVFGPNEDHKGDMRSVVHKATAQIRETGSVRLFRSHHPDYPDGGQKRDFLYVKDCVEMTLHLARSPLAGGLFNLGSGEARTWLDLVTPIFEALNQPVQIEFVDMPEALRGKYQYFTQANIRRLRDSGYDRPVTALSAAVRDYVTGYLMPDRRLGDGDSLSA